MEKTIGTLLPFNSLVSNQYPDDLFKSAELFIDWLAKTGQNVWAMLPISASYFRNDSQLWESPYSSYGIGLNPRFLTEAEQQMTYPKASREFLEKNKDWVFDYGKFLALAEQHGTDYWPNWSTQKTADLDRINYFINQQAYLLSKFKNLKKYANDKGVVLWGDLPFYLTINSPLVWAHRDEFLINSNGTVDYVAGSRGNKHFCKTQIWGFPLYTFKSANLWKMRLDYFSKLHDEVRLDAAVRFFAYEKLDLKNLEKDERVPGPGEKFFGDLVAYARNVALELFAEDISDFDMSQLYKVCARLNVPTMSVFTMILAPEERRVDPADFNLHFPAQQIYYTSTHDTLPLLPYLESLLPSQHKAIAEVFNILPGAPTAMAKAIKKVLLAKTNNLIVPIQDWLGTRERINIPGIANARNWNYVMTTAIEDLPLQNG